MVLEELQFSTISAGTKCVSKSDTKLNFIPNTCFLQDLESAISEAEQAKWDASTEAQQAEHARPTDITLP